ncbi:ACT domain-containing protein [Planotetraspora sp. GP83]|uniref:ACT domain-containing protein n=1 Tax=Planotetraspora sp. GP83 TaxID=3156264 RepID=UPI003516B90F
MIGRDRPGVIAEVTGALADRGAIGDSSMILLGDYLAMILVITAGLGADRLGEGLTGRFPGYAVGVADLVETSLVSAHNGETHNGETHNGETHNGETVRAAREVVTPGVVGDARPMRSPRGLGLVETVRTGLGYVLTLHGPSQGDVLPVLTGLLAGSGCSITSLITRVAGDLLVLVADVELPERADVPSLMRGMSSALDDHRIAFRPAEPAVI